jgi:hypothetical protein
MFNAKDKDVLTALNSLGLLLKKSGRISENEFDGWCKRKRTLDYAALLNIYAESETLQFEDLDVLARLVIENKWGSTEAIEGFAIFTEATTSKIDEISVVQDDPYSDSNDPSTEADDKDADDKDTDYKDADDEDDDDSSDNKGADTDGYETAIEDAPKKKAGKVRFEPIPVNHRKQNSHRTATAATTSRPTQNHQPIDILSGTNQDVDEWFARFDLISKVNYWDEPYKLLQLGLYLKGEAMMLYRDIEQEGSVTYETMRTHLVSKLRPIDCRGGMSEYLSLALADGERIEAFKSRFKRCVETTPQLARMPMEQQTMDFVRCLPAEIRSYMMMVEPRTVDEAAKYYNHYVERNGTRSVKSVNSIEQKEAPQGPQTTLQTTQHPDRNSQHCCCGHHDRPQSTAGQYNPVAAVTHQPSNNQRSRMEDIKCYRCGDKGHYASRCEKFSFKLQCGVCGNKGHHDSVCALKNKSNLN